MSEAFLSDGKRELLKKLLRERGLREGGREPTRPSRHEPGSPAPLYPNQAGIWFLDQMHPDRADFSIPACVRLEGELDVSALAHAIDQLVARHETLRTRFVAGEDGAPVQIVRPHEPLEVELVSLEALAPEAREREASRLATAEAHRPFDLGAGELLRASLLRLGPREHVLLLNVHHIVSDGWSMGILTRELDTLYTAFRRGDPSPLEPLPLQFVDFVLEEERRLQGETLERHLEFWRTTLAGSSDLALPGDAGPAVPNAFSGKHHSFHVPEETTRSLRRLSIESGVTLYSVLMAAFKVVLSAVSRQADLVVGTTFANRGRVELESLVGFFANTLPLRTDLSDNPSFRELCSRVGRASLDAQAHQALPFATLVSKLRPKERSADASPFFRVVFDVLTPDVNPAVYGYGMDCAIDDAQKLGDLRMSPIAVEGGVARFDIAVFVWALENELRGTFEFRPSAIDEAALSRMARDLTATLALVASEPELEVSAIEERLESRARAEAGEYRRSIRSSLRPRRRKAIQETPR